MTALLFLTCLAALASYRAVEALMAAGAYRILIAEAVTVGNSTIKRGGAYTMMGSAAQTGSETLKGGSYTVTLGTVNSWRPAQTDVSIAHVYPNPCNLGSGCNNVNFTRLTMDATIRVYTISGELVATIKKSSSIDSIGWDLRNSGGRQVASGLYIYIVEGGGSVKRGKMVIVR
ncbi:MAG TPA: T9SS type A sorting domain-containing protein [Elusimicrobiales bacterium]|nr:T9SS type A sorting domain-containing protein [Elusimicrobiales bacterium]